MEYVYMQFGSLWDTGGILFISFYRNEHSSNFVFLCSLQ
jgi:hypothetical protein